MLLDHRNAHTDLALLPGLPVGTGLTNGLPATLDSDTTATLTIDSAIWGRRRGPGQVTVEAATVTDFVLTIDVAGGAAASYGWSGTIQTILGQGTLSGELAGAEANFYSAEATGGPGADGAVFWICGGGGRLAQATRNPSSDPGSLGTWPPDATNLRGRGVHG